MTFPLNWCRDGVITKRLTFSVRVRPGACERKGAAPTPPPQRRLDKTLRRRVASSERVNRRTILCSQECPTLDL